MNRSLQLALRIGSRYAEGNARLILGYILNQARKYESAIRESMLASEAFRSVGVVPGAADALLNAAGIYGDCGEVSTSERLLEELDPLALERNLYVFRSTFQRGDLLLRAGRLVEAEAYLRAAREQA